jgi:hypothetical protein
MEESAMSDILGGIKPLGPSYPIAPVRPGNKDRETGKRHQQHEEPRPEHHEDDDEQPHIDELA